MVLIGAATIAAAIFFSIGVSGASLAGASADRSEVGGVGTGGPVVDGRLLLPSHQASYQFLCFVLC